MSSVVNEPPAMFSKRFLTNINEWDIVYMEIVCLNNTWKVTFKVSCLKALFYSDVRFIIKINFHKGESYSWNHTHIKWSEKKTVLRITKLYRPQLIRGPQNPTRYDNIEYPNKLDQTIPFRLIIRDPYQ